MGYLFVNVVNINKLRSSSSEIFHLNIFPSVRQRTCLVLTVWKAYRIALHRLDPSAEEITWPGVPRG
ncbi:tail fiber assembly protein [Candidatus Hamiltonella endosymbiont of Tuberolachnus salignus]|uniref:tail fiber assembly protein n=1 Tax=Candidatus Williamhamiltonella endosymbiont of Tuberolachnus salignus TaxID=3077954 RepID=UPI003BB0F869